MANYLLVCNKCGRKASFNSSTFTMQAFYSSPCGALVNDPSGDGAINCDGRLVIPEENPIDPARQCVDTIFNQWSGILSFNENVREKAADIIRQHFSFQEDWKTVVDRVTEMYEGTVKKKEEELHQVREQLDMSITALRKVAEATGDPEAGKSRAIEDVVTEIKERLDNEVFVSKKRIDTLRDILNILEILPGESEEIIEQVRSIKRVACDSTDQSLKWVMLLQYIAQAAGCLPGNPTESTLEKVKELKSLADRGRQEPPIESAAKLAYLGSQIGALLAKGGWIGQHRGEYIIQCPLGTQMAVGATLEEVLEKASDDKE
jgi:negative regulator of replication initiation